MSETFVAPLLRPRTPPQPAWRLALGIAAAVALIAFGLGGTAHFPPVARDSAVGTMIAYSIFPCIGLMAAAGFAFGRWAPRRVLGGRPAYVIAFGVLGAVVWYVSAWTIGYPTTGGRIHDQVNIEMRSYARQLIADNEDFGRRSRTLDIEHVLDAHTFTHGNDIAARRERLRQARLLAEEARARFGRRQGAMRQRLVAIWPQAATGFDAGSARGRELTDRVARLNVSLVGELDAALDVLNSTRGQWQASGGMFMFSSRMAMERYNAHAMRIAQLSSEARSLEAELQRNEGMMRSVMTSADPLATSEQLGDRYLRQNPSDPFVRRPVIEARPVVEVPPEARPPGTR